MGKKIRHELDRFKDQVISAAASGHCEGSCDEHSGEVQPVRVFGKDGYDWGYFSYCEAARAEDTENRCMTIEAA